MKQSFSIYSLLACICYRLLTIFQNYQNYPFQKNTFWEDRVLNELDPDQDRHSVGPDLGPTCLQRLSADDKIRR